MNKLIIFSVILFAVLSIQITNAQTPKSPLSRVINVSGTIQVAPSLSGDGKHMIFTSSSNLKSELLLFYSYQQRPGKWTQPEPIITINRSKNINHIGGYSLSYDGDYIYFTSRKTPGIGKYDIWYSKRTGNNEWSAPINLGKPINSTKDDGCPSLSADGKTMYFVRCESMDQNVGTGCKLMMANKRNKDFWDKPVALPANINIGNILSPKILVDNQTLIFAKGEEDQMDLYQTRKSGDDWSDPIALDYINTANGDERFASILAQGDVIYYSTEYKGTYDIIKAKIPKEFQPLKVVYLKGKVVDTQGAPLEAFIQIYDIDSQDLIQYHRTESDNSGFEFYIPAGKRYDFSVVPLAAKHFFYSKMYDLTELETSTRSKLDVTLSNLESGAIFPLHCLEFENDSTLSKVSRFEMSRLIKLLKNNPGTQMEIGVHRDSFEYDSLQLVEDTLFVTEPLVTESSLHVLDSLELPQEIVTEPPPDPTEIKAEAISKYLKERGVPDYLIVPMGYADSQPLEIDDGNDEAKGDLNKRVEIKIL